MAPSILCHFKNSGTWHLSCSEHTWIHSFINCGKLPLHQYGHFWTMVLDDKDFSHGITFYLLKISKKDTVHAQDIMDYVQLPNVQGKLASSGLKSKISLWTAQRWLTKLRWRDGRKRNGMYLDGHEQADVVKYRKAFMAIQAEYEKHMVHYGNDGKIDSIPNRFSVKQVVQFCLLLLTHDESTFFADDPCKTPGTCQVQNQPPNESTKGSH